jgi:hypothetical protein
MAPELFENVPYDERVDVYSYAMVVWEMITGQTPFSGKTPLQVEDMIVYEERRPPIPVETPQGLKDLLTSCWDRDPTRRPSFDAIFEAFRSHKVFFLNTNDKEVDLVVERMSTMDPQMKAPPQEVELPEELRAADPSDNPFLAGEAIVMPSLDSPDFAREIQAVARSVTQDNLGQFYDGIVPMLATREKAQLAAIFRALTIVFSDRTRLALFVERDLHSLIPIASESVCQELSVVLLHLFSYHPECISAEIIAAVGEIALAIPSESLNLFNLYLTYEKQLPHRELVYDNVLKHAESYIFLSLSFNLVSYLRGYQNQDPQFLQSRADAVHTVFSQALDIGDDRAQEFLLNLILANPEFASIVSPKSLSRLLMDSALHQKALEICSKHPLLFDADVIAALLANAQRNELATRTLIVRCAVEEDVSAVTAALGPMWVGVKLPTLKDTLELTLTLLIYQSAREILAHCENISLLFIALSDSGLPEFRTAIVKILRVLPFKSDFVSNCDRYGFLEKYYRKALLTPESFCWVEVLLVTTLFARAGMSVQYLLLLPTLKKMVGNKVWRLRAVSVLATLSTHRDMRAHLADEGLMESMSKFKDDPQLALYASHFLDYVHRVDDTEKIG